MKSPLIISALIATIGISTSIAKDEKVSIALIGDSTVTNSAGWGKAFAARFGDHVTVQNFALGGRSAKSFLEENRLPPVLTFKPDYVFIQFGHNGQAGKGPNRETDPKTSYRNYLRRYVKLFRRIGTTPIIVSSVIRRRVDQDGKIADTLKPWAQASRSVAEELNIPFIDLHQISMTHHRKIGPEASHEFNLKDGDYTHFNEKGAKVISNLIVQEMKKVLPELVPFLQTQQG